MARKPRVHYPAALYHVIMRGNARQDIFFDEKDRYRFYLLLQEGVERFGHRIHAYCLMTNHIHLAIQVGEVPLSRIMQNIGFRYTRWINWRMNRIGHLFQGRFKAVLVDADTYLLELTRYLHLNPLRADMVQAPEDYQWSSYRGYLGLETIPWLTTDWVLSQFSGELHKARLEYRKFVNLGKKDGHLQEFHSGTNSDCRILGDDNFIDKVLFHAEARPKRPANLAQILEDVCREYAIGPNDLATQGKNRYLSEARGMAAWLMLETGLGTLAELGKRMRRDPTTLSSAATRLQLRAKTDQALAVKMKGLLERLG